MWRQMLRSLPKSINHICCKNTAQKVARRRRVLLHSVFLMSAAHVIIDHPDDAANENTSEVCNDEADAPVTDIAELQLTSDIESTYSGSGKALNDLIKTLHACIQEICDQYQHCVARQIEIMMQCMEMEPVGAHWDEMTKYRVTADDLRVEFNKYRTLVTTIGSIVNNERFKEAGTGDKGDKAQVSEAYKLLIELIENRTQENKSWDSKLVDVHMKSILITETETK